MPATASTEGRPTPVSRADLPAALWSGRTTFRHGQCDPAGIVYTPKFFDIFNQIIERWFCEHLGLDYYELIGGRKIGLGYVNASATFFTPCKMGETVDIFVRVDHIGTRSYALSLHAIKDNNEALRGTFTTVVTDLETNAARTIPDDVRDALSRYADVQKDR